MQVNWIQDEDTDRRGETLALRPVLAGQRILSQVVSFDIVTISFLGALATIGLISAYDAYIVKLYGSFIQEQNPVCAMLIAGDPKHLSYFLVAKATGTMTSLLALVFLFSCRRRLALPVVFGVTGFQVGLAIYLNTGR